MKVLVTCDSYKDCLTASEVGESIISGIKSVHKDWNIQHIPNADGGEGSLSAISVLANLEKEWCNTFDPLLRAIECYYLVDRKHLVAYIEMASASGIELLKTSERNGLYTTTYGTGLMMADAINKGFNHIVFFVGGSATSEMGIGMANGLGVEFYDTKKVQINKPRGIDLKDIASVKIPNYLKKITLTLISDVDNPLYGSKGAAYVYGPQKGCDSNAIILLDEGMKSLNGILKEHYNIDHAFEKGTGAAGGIGAMCYYLFQTSMKLGGEFMFNMLNIKEQLIDSDIIITGEGSLDNQTRYGKLINRLGHLSNLHNKKLIVVCGKITASKSELEEMHIHKSYSISEITGNAPYTSESTQENLKKIGHIIGSIA